MESSVVPRSSARPTLAVAAFAAYGCWSLLSSSDLLAGVMVGQAVLYLAVAVALARRADWAGWFAVGIATSGLAVDALFLTGWSFNPGMAADTAMQAGLLWLALRSRALVGTADSTHRLTSTAAPQIGWTFALAAGVLPPAVMGALMPTSTSCFGLFVPWEGSGDLVVLAFLVLGGLGMITRLRTGGLLALVAGFAIASSTMWRAALEGWAMFSALKSLFGPTDAFATDQYPALQPGHYMGVIALGFAFAALVPLGPQFVRALFPRKIATKDE